MVHKSESDLSTYLSRQPDIRRERLEDIISLIKRLFPNAEVSLKYRMPTFSLGRNWVAVASQKHYISLYTCSAEHIAEFRQQHPKVITGKCCINFRDRDGLYLDDLEGVIKHALEA